jgi:hypothetical protein
MATRTLPRTSKRGHQTGQQERPSFAGPDMPSARTFRTSLDVCPEMSGLSREAMSCFVRDVRAMSGSCPGRKER